MELRVFCPISMTSGRHADAEESLWSICNLYDEFDWLQARLQEEEGN